MKRRLTAARISPLSLNGFTLMEVIIVIAVFGILVAISFPSIVSWRKSLDYNQVAREMTTMLRQAHSQAISTNVPQMVVFKPNSSSYQWITSPWTSSPKQVEYCPTTVALRTTTSGTSTGNVYAQFNTNGTVSLQAPDGTPSDGNVTVNNGSTVMYQITINRTGRIQSQRM